ncbi:MAG: hypothetical protein D6722_14460, partial [Bacteroidetes bacterium]
STVLGDFDDQVHVSRGITSRFFRRDGGFWVNTQGPDGAYHDYEVQYTFGVYPLQQYLVPFPKGRYQALRVAWDGEKNRWMDLYPDLDIAPGEWLHWGRDALNWNSRCAECHSTNLKKNYFPEADSFHTTYSIINVSCEACHGPGQPHVNYVQSAAYAAGERVEGSYTYLHMDESSEAQVDQCGRCHARRSQITGIYDHELPFMAHYVPELLVDGTYFADGQILDEDYVYGSFVQSQMYHQGVRCVNCHNPHKAALKIEGNALCLQCHAPDTFDTPNHHFHLMNTEASQCINCHMTGRFYMVNDFRRDHSFRIPRPDQTVAYGTPNACNGCHTEESPQWAADQVEAWYGPERKAHFSDALTKGRSRRAEAIPDLMALARDPRQPAIARATGLTLLSESPGGQEVLQTVAEALQDSSPLMRQTAANALVSLEPQAKAQLVAPLLRDPVRAVRIAAANTLADVPPALLAEYQPAWEQARSEWEHSLEVRAEFRSGQLMAGQYYDRRGEVAQAEAAYRKALRMDSLFNPARINLATLLNRQGRNTEAEALLRTVISQEPGYGPAYYSLGLLLAEENRLEEAAALLEEGAHRVGNNPRIFYNWGLSLQHLERPQAAVKAYLEGLQADPDFPELHQALAILYLQQGEPEQARPYAEWLRLRFPQNPQIQQLVAEVERQLSEAR